MEAVTTPLTLDSNALSTDHSTTYSTFLRRRFSIVNPHALLIEPERLTPSERRWQWFFVCFPWLAFACVISLPLGMVSFLVNRHKLVV